MTLRQRYLKILSAIAPSSALGAALLLGSVTPGTAAEDPVKWQPRASDEVSVSDRLAAIRQAASELAGSDREGSGQHGQQLAWWGNWRNGGWGPGGWRNGRWRRPGWRNGPWHNFWRNW